MFPLKDVSGRIVGFSGRIFEDDPKNPQAKYLNSPETEVFDKSRALYGIERARDGIRNLGAALLVEGQFDLIMAHQAGYGNAVATSGTAFTERHAENLKRYSQNLLICYDGDKAGIAAAGRAAAIALRFGMNVKVAKLPPGKDPADLLKEEPSVFKDAVKSALPVPDFYLAHLADAKYDARTFKLEVTRVVLPHVAMIGNKIEQAHFVKRIADALQVPETAVAAELSKIGATGQYAPASKQAISDVHNEPFLSRGDSVQRLLSGLAAVFRESADDVLAEKIEQSFRETLSGGERLASEDAERAGVFEAELFLERYPEREALITVIEELIDTLKRESAHERYRDTLSALRAAELAKNAEETEALMQKLASLAADLK
jgi:DNA primase